MTMQQQWPVIAGVGPVDVKARFTANEHIRLILEVERAVWRARDERGAGAAVAVMAPGFNLLFARAALHAGLSLRVYRLEGAQRLTGAQRGEWEVICGQAAEVAEVASIREAYQAVVEDADAVVACWYPYEFAGETYHALARAVRAGKPAVQIDPTVPRSTEATRLPREQWWRDALRLEPAPLAQLVA